MAVVSLAAVSRLTTVCCQLHRIRQRDRRLAVPLEQAFQGLGIRLWHGAAQPGGQQFQLVAHELGEVSGQGLGASPADLQRF